MNTAERHRYYASREWATLKAAVRERSGGLCERCRRRPYTQTHHTTYERMGRERLDDLQGLCDRCHEFLSAKRQEDPAAFIDGDVVKGSCACCRGPEALVFRLYIGLHGLFICEDCFERLSAWFRAEQVA
jgi:hypothetical protein